MTAFYKTVRHRFVTETFGGYHFPDVQRDGYLDLRATDNLLRTIGVQFGDSVNSSLPARKLQKTVAWVPKKYPLKAPIKPVLWLPKLPTLYKRRDGQSRSSWNRVVTRYNKLVELIIRARGRNTVKYENRMLKYEKRMAKYLHLVYLTKNGTQTYKKLKTRYSEWHPYSITKTLSYPFQGVLVYRFNQWSPGYFEGEYWHNGHYIPGTVGQDMTVQYGASGHNLLPGQSVNPAPSITNPEVFSAIAIAEERAKKQFFDKLQKQEVHIGNIIAERHQTLKTLVDLIGRINNLLLKRDKLSLTQIIGGKQKGSIDKKLSNDFLAFQFGIRPLMSDVFSALEVLAQAGLDSEPVVCVRSQGKGKSYYKAGYDGVYAIETKVRFVVEYRIDNQALATLNSLGLVNPLEIAWEVMPWSFVVDWFAPIGAWIHAMNNSTGLVFKRGTKTVTSRVTTSQLVAGSLPPDAIYGGSSWSGRYDREMSKKERTVMLYAWQMFTPDLPSLKNPFSMYHVAEAIALLRQRFR